MHYTVEQVKFNIATDQKWLERAIQVIYLAQTADERQAGETKHLNGVGFNGCDAKFLSYCAKYLESNPHLTGTFLEKARKLMPKYAGQILKVIEANPKNKKRRVA